jgi:cytidine deaminase
MESLSAVERNLVETASAVLDAIKSPLPPRIYTPTCASAILTSAGRIFTGVNLSHFSGGACAEFVALGNANAAGILNCNGGKGEVLTHITAVLDRGRGVVNPCGRCRQILSDYHPGIKVIVVDVGGRLECVELEKLLPVAYVWPLVGMRSADDEATT